MERQLTIFDYISPPEEYNIEKMTSGEMAQAIGAAIGFEFAPSGWDDEYEAAVTKKLKFTVHKSHYSCDTVDKKEGDAFISVGYSFGTSGSGSPTDSIESAVDYFKRTLKRYIL